MIHEMLQDLEKTYLKTANQKITAQIEILKDKKPSKEYKRLMSLQKCQSLDERLNNKRIKLEK